MSKDKGGGFISVDRNEALKKNWDLIQRIERPGNTVTNLTKIINESDKIKIERIANETDNGNIFCG